jgi:plasmid stabilization system protein ParE
MEALFDLLSQQPHIGERTITRRYGEVRRHSKGKYVVYYRIADDGLQVLRVLHDAREHGDLV